MLGVGCVTLLWLVCLCTDEVRVKVRSFQESHILLHYKIFYRDDMQLHFCLFEDAVILDESFYLQSDFSFYKMNNNQRFCDNLTYVSSMYEVCPRKS